MNERDIRSFSLEALLEVNGRRPEDLYFNGCLIASRVDVKDELIIDLFRYPTRLNAFAVIFCSKGSIVFSSGLNRHELVEKTFFVHLPGSILQLESMREAAVHAIICEEEFIKRINIDLKLLSGLFLQVEKHPCLSLDEQEWAEIIGSFGEIRTEGAVFREDVYSAEILRSMVRTLAYKICRVIGRHIEPNRTGSVRSAVAMRSISASL